MTSKRRTPPDLPGMYFDTERNRYFPLKTPKFANGNSRVKTEEEQVRQGEEFSRIQREDAALHKRRISNTLFAAVDKSEDGNAVLRLLQKREMSGHSWKKKSGTNSFSFQRQMLETQTGPMNSAEQPKIWSYDPVHCEGGLEQCRLDLQTAEGMVEGNAMVAGGFNEVQILQVCGPEDAFVWGDEHVASRIRLLPCPLRYKEHTPKAPILRPVFAKLPFTSMITSVKKLNEWREGDNIDSGNHLTQNVILTTLGNEGEGGSIYLMRARQCVLNESSRPFSRRLRVQINSDIFTAECNPRGKQVSLGLKAGAAVLDVERSEVYRTFNNKSSVLAQQFDSSGNVLLCGHRNGLILAYDLRLPPPICSQTQQRQTGAREPKQRERMQMGSTVSSMSLLRSCEHYLIASAMNGEIWQWDRRMARRGPVQIFEGHVNTHSLLQLRLDPSESLLASGGTDGSLRLWSVKSGQLLYVERKLGCVPRKICWNSSYFMSNVGSWGYSEEPRFKDDSPWALWTGSTTLLHIRGGRGT